MGELQQSWSTSRSNGTHSPQEFKITNAKQDKVRAHATSLLSELVKSRGGVSRGSLRYNAGVTFSLLFALPLALFYTRLIHDVLISAMTKFAARSGERARISRGNERRAKKHLKEWYRLGKGRRLLVEQEHQFAVHTDAAERGEPEDLTKGLATLCCARKSDCGM